MGVAQSSSRNDEENENENEDFLNDTVLNRLENADINLYDTDDKWTKSTVLVENGKIFIEGSQRRASRASIVQFPASSRDLLSTLPSTRDVLNAMGSSRDILGRKSSVHEMAPSLSNMEIKLSERPVLKVEERNGKWEFIVTGKNQKIRIRAVNEEQAQTWLKLMRYEVMRTLNTDLFFADTQYDAADDYRINMFGHSFIDNDKDGGSGPDGAPNDSSAAMNEINELIDAEVQDDEEEAEEADRQKFNQTHQSIEAPKMNIVILVVGTRGDVQPFVYLGQQLQKDGHRVRLATHAEYREDVTTKGGLEYYPLEGDPRKLSEYMVKTGGRLLPDLLNKEELKEIPEKMKMLKDITFSTWPACTAPDPVDPLQKPFVADAIISNPVSYGHIHCAQALAIPLHIMFPQPWSPTKCFPHPLSNLSLESEWSSKNYYSYLMVDEFMWLGLGGMINQFRKKILKLHVIRFGERGESLLNIWKVPISHMWSPSFVPKCRDWNVHVDVVGEFRSTDTTSNNVFQPSPKLSNFLLAGPKPLYIGFGSMVIDDSSKLKNIIIKAASQTKCRVLLQSGWTKYAEDYNMLSPEVMVVGAMPHDYLFSVVTGVVHHGGAGTTSAGLRAGNPTFICPFFGDQHFWAEMVHRSGAGPKGCPVRELTVEKMIESLQIMRDPNTVTRAKLLSIKMQAENGTLAGVNSFYRNLPLHKMVCDVSIFDNQQSRIANVFCLHCGLKMCELVDRIIHREEGGRKSHIRVPYKSKLWGRSIKKAASGGGNNNATNNNKDNNGHTINNSTGGVSKHNDDDAAAAAAKQKKHRMADVKSRLSLADTLKNAAAGNGDITAVTNSTGSNKEKKVTVTKGKATTTTTTTTATAATKTATTTSTTTSATNTTGIKSPAKSSLKSAAAKTPAVPIKILTETEAIEEAYAKATAFLAFWDKVDADGNGVLDETELSSFFANKEDAQTIMQLVDWDGDHILTFTELAWFIAQKTK